MDKDKNMERVETSEQAKTTEVPEPEIIETSEGLQCYEPLSLLTKRAIAGALKLLDGAHGGGFFVKFLKDEGTCYGWLALIIVYPDGTYKTIVSFKNYLRETDTESGDGLYSTPVPPAKPKMYTQIYWDGDELKNCYSSLERYSTPDMPIPEQAIWARIREFYKYIPICRISQTASPEHLLSELRETAKGKAKEYGQGFMIDEGKFYIEPEDFRKVVEDNGWTISQARTEFDQLGLLEKDSNTRGYQKTKRVGNTTKRFYVIKNIAEEPEPKFKTLANVEFPIPGKTRLEGILETQREKYDKLLEECQRLSKKCGEGMII